LQVFLKSMVAEPPGTIVPPGAFLFSERKGGRMPVFSYLAQPIPGARKDLLDELGGVRHCEIVPSDNEDVLVLVTDTPDQKAEEQLQESLRGLKSLQCLSMTFGHVDEKTVDPTKG
jgi:nitrate reductase NapAB chaperone NapD